MPTIRFSIGTQSFTLACEEGQEPHIRKLEKSVNTRFENMQRTFGSAGNQLVMAVTMLMMEEDLQKKQPSQSTAENYYIKQFQCFLQAFPAEGQALQGFQL